MIDVKSAFSPRWHQLGSATRVSGLREWPKMREFVDKYAVGHLPAEPLWILTDLIAGPEKILLLADGRAIAGIAVVVDTCQNSTNSAELLVLAALPEALTADALEALLATAEGVAAKGPKQRLEMAVTTVVQLAGEGLSRRSYHRAYAVFDLRLELVEPHRSIMPPPELYWTDPSLADARAYHRAVTASFEGQPGVGLAPFKAFRTAFEKHRDDTRLLKADDEIVGFVRWTMLNKAVGRIDLLGRIPSYRGENLGALLLDEALQQVHRRGADTVEIQVATENPDAIGLYRSAGFIIVDQTESFMKEL